MRTLAAFAAVALASAALTASSAAQQGGSQAPADPNAKFDYFGGLTFDESVPSPAQFLGYEIGEHFTRHADVLDYVRKVAETSDRATWRPYGKTHERRTLSILTITSPSNHARLDEILAKNLELTDPRKTNPARAQQIARDNPAVVWLSYNVHGNEASGSEAAMQVAYTMAAATNDEVRDILDKVVFVLDPMINPDGRDRYANWYEMNLAIGQGRNARSEAAEHREPWPGGRTNHYYFDLNRDWLWMVHPESQGRIALYKTVMPQLHVDYHEQGSRSPYFFGAGEDPYNANIPQETKDWLNIYGEANAAAFDREGLVYATRERFDYLYPGYGKVLPVYHGAIGLLTEKGGGGGAGLAVHIEGEYTLTLRERARHHFVTSMSYLETTAAKRQATLERFYRFFARNLEPSSEMDKAYVISAGNDPALLEKVWKIASGHGIEIYTLDGETRISGLSSYATGMRIGESVSAGSWVIPTAQPMGALTRAVFERSTFVSELETYDITGWSLPISFGLTAGYTKDDVTAPMTRLDSYEQPTPQLTGEGDFALLVDAAQHSFPRAVGAAIRHDIFARRVGDTPVQVDGRTFAPGSLIVNFVRNDRARLRRFALDTMAAGLNIHRVDTGLVERGPVLGTNANGLFALPNILLVRGTPVSGNSYGQHWHLIDIEADLPHTSVNADALAGVDLDDYNVIVYPAGGLARGAEDAIRDWVRSGGTLVASGSSTGWATRDIAGVEGDDVEDDRTPLKDLTYEERQQRSAEDNIPGPMLRVALDTSHPLTTGLGAWIGALKQGARTLDVADGGYVVAKWDESPRIGGVISERNQERFAGSPFMTHHNVGRGNVICVLEDATFRGFLHAPMRLLLNGIIFGPSL